VDATFKKGSAKLALFDGPKLTFLILSPIVAIQCIGEAFGVDLTDAVQGQTYSTKPATLVSIFDVFVNAQKKLGNKVRHQSCVSNHGHKWKAMHQHASML